MITTDDENGVDWVLATVHTIWICDLESVQDIYLELTRLGQKFKDMPIAGRLEECDGRWKTR